MPFRGDPADLTRLLRSETDRKRSIVRAKIDAVVASSGVQETSSDADNLYPSSGSHHTSQGRHLRANVELGFNKDQPRDENGQWVRYGVGFTPVGVAAIGAAGYRTQHNLGAGPSAETLKDTTANPAHRAAAARAYANMPTFDETALPAYRTLAAEIEEQRRYITETLGVKMITTAEDPYPDVESMVRDINENHQLKVMSTATTGSHPFFADEQNDAFRFVHDFFGHAATGRDFSRHGERAAYLEHASMMRSKDAVRALFTETEMQNAALIATGQFQDQKVALAPDRMVFQGLGLTASAEPSWFPSAEFYDESQPRADDGKWSASGGHGFTSNGDVEDAFTMAGTTYSTMVMNVERTHDGFKIESGLMDADGEPVGASERTVHIAKDGTVTVKHESLSLEPQAQGKGIGAEYLRDSAAMYHQMGVSAITTAAVSNLGVTNGAYTWARLGFRLKDENARHSLSSHIRQGIERYEIPESLRGLSEDIASGKADMDAVLAHPDGPDLLKGVYGPIAWSGKLPVVAPVTASATTATIDYDAWVEAELALPKTTPVTASVPLEFYAEGQAREPAGSSAGGEFVGTGPNYGGAKLISTEMIGTSDVTRMDFRLSSGGQLMIQASPDWVRSGYIPAMVAHADALQAAEGKGYTMRIVAGVSATERTIQAMGQTLAKIGVGDSAFGFVINGRDAIFLPKAVGRYDRIGNVSPTFHVATHAKGIDMVLGTIDHEHAHYVDFMINEEGGGKVIPRRARAAEAALQSQLRADVSAHETPDLALEQAGMSKYGMKNRDEFHAEAFSIIQAHRRQGKPLTKLLQQMADINHWETT